MVNRLGITIRIGSGGFAMTGPEGAFDLTHTDRQQRGTLASLLSDSLGLMVEERPSRKPHRASRFNRRNVNRKGTR